ncbi:hypothetical protein Hdeb2414_s0597g00922081 [Helianthus debilis subsp. tardiflorus]
MNMMCCLLCYKDYDSHDHLFFSCYYSTQVWFHIRAHAEMENVQPVWSDVFTEMIQRKASKRIEVIVARLTVAAAAYYIWKERNTRLFQNNARPPDKLAQEILSTVRYKLMGLKFKESARMARMLEKWNIRGDEDYDMGAHSILS